MAESSTNNHRQVPCHLSHLPILTVDYKNIDENAGYGDAEFMDIGQSTWNKADISGKIWRRASSGNRWSRQSGELPLLRILDLAILVAAAATGKQSTLQEFMQREDMKDTLQDLSQKICRCLVQSSMNCAEF